MKKVLVLLAMVLGVTNMYAQDYDLEGLAKLCQKYELSSFHDGLCKAFDQERGYLFFDTKGKEVLCVSSDEVLDFSDGLLSVKNIDGKYGYLDKSGNVAIPFVFDDAYSFMNGVAVVEKGNKKYHIDKNGNEIAQAAFEYGASDYAEGDYFNDFHDGRAIVFKDSKYGAKYGAVNMNREIVIPLEYEELYSFSDSVAWATKGGGKWVVLDVNGSVLFTLNHVSERPTSFSEGLAVVKTASNNHFKLSLINKKGDMVQTISEGESPGQVYDFNEGLAPIYKEEGVGYIDMTGQIVIPTKYLRVTSFHNGFARVFNKDYKWGVINKNGEIVLPFVYEEFSNDAEGLIKAKKNDKYGWLNSNYKVVIPIKYDVADDFSDGLAQVELFNVGQGFVDKYGNSTFNPPASSSTSQKTNDGTTTVTETMPSFVGGQTAMFRWISEHLQYPEEAMNKGIKGRVVASFYVEKDGTIGNVEIEKSVHPLLDNETIRLLKSMPKWIPGTQDGSPVRVKYTVPLTYNFTEE